MFMLFSLAVLILLIPILSVVLESPVGKAIGSRLERRKVARGGQTASYKQVERMEGELQRLGLELERLGLELERLDEEGRFMQKLRESRQEPRALPPDDGPAA